MSPDSAESGRAEETADLLLDLAEALHAVQAPADEIDAIVGAAARRLGVRVDLVLFQSYLGGEIGRRAPRRAFLRRMPFDTSWKLARVRELLALSSSLAEGRIGVSEGRAELSRIVARPNPYGNALVVLAYGVYGAAVAARVGGAWLEVGVGGLVGVVAGLIHYGTIHHPRVDLQQTFIAGFAGSIAALLCMLALPAFDFGRALFGGVTLLVPAMVVTIATHELANDALESGTVRFVYGLLRFVMLAVGIGAAMKLWSLVFALPEPAHATALPIVVVLPLIALGGAALIVCLQARLRDAPWIIGAALLAYGTQELTKVFFGDTGAPLACALVLGAAAYLQARLPGHVPATVLVPGLLQLAPGFLGTESVLHLLQGRGGGDWTFFRVLLVALQLVTGLIVASVLFHRRPRLAGKSRVEPHSPA